MDFTQAALIGLVIFVVIEGLKRTIDVPSRALVPIAFILGVAATFLVGASDWANTQVIDGHALDTLNVASKVIVGIVYGSIAVGIDQGIKTVKNIGQNQ